MDINIIGTLNEGYRRGVLGRNNSVSCFLTDEGKRQIQYVRRDIDKFIRNRENISGYLSMVGKGEKDEHEFDKAIFDAIDTKKDNKFIKFLYRNSERIKDIAITTKHTSALVILEMSTYIRDYLLGAGEISCANGKFAVYKNNE